MKNIIFYTTHKSGSMFAYRLFKRLSDMKKLTFYSTNLPDTSPNYMSNDDSKLKISNQSCVCPIRFYSEFSEVLNPTIILQLRDPRDVLVSLYYSVAYSHALKSDTARGPTEIVREETLEKGINQFVIDCSAKLRKRYETYIKELLPDRAILLRYEDMVTDFEEWITPIAQEFNLTIEEKKEIISQYRDEFIPEKENKYVHKRKMIPGDYKEKLEPETIEKLNFIFKDILEKLKYDFTTGMDALYIGGDLHDTIT